MSVNRAWRGKRWKTPDYKSYEAVCMYMLPTKIYIPDGDLQIEFEFGFSNNTADLDNPIKQITDILQKKYGFNDSRIYKIMALKVIVPKGQEYIKLRISSYSRGEGSLIISAIIS